MAQDVTVQGASYSDVPSVVLPKTGGGTAVFTDISDTTAIADDVAYGVIFFTEDGKTEGTLQFSSIHTGSSVPSSSLGVDGDIYLQV